MKDFTLNRIKKKKIRRQYFNAPLIILYSLMLWIPYAIITFSLCDGDANFYEWPSVISMSLLICFSFSLPFLILRTLNKHFFGRIICALNEEGIFYSNEAKIRWETIQKIEYVIDSRLRYKNDKGNSYRLIIYTQGNKHIVLNKVPIYIISVIKKYRKNIDIKLFGVKSLISTTLIMATILLLSPFYAWLLSNAPGASTTQYTVFVIIAIIFTIIRFIIVFNIDYIEYRFWRKILPKKWLSYILLAAYYFSYFAGLLLLVYFPSWVMVSLFGIYVGIVQPPVPPKHGYNHRKFYTYNELYKIYITDAAFWEGEIEKNKVNRK